MKKILLLLSVIFIGVFPVEALEVTSETTLKSCLTATDNEECILVADIELTSPVISSSGKIVDLNGNTLKGDVVGIINVNNGDYYTSSNFHILGKTTASYLSENASVQVATNGDLTILSGEVELGMSMCTTPGQVITIKENATFTIPTGKELQLYSLIKNEGNLIIKGRLTQFTTKEGGSLKTSNPDLYNSTGESNAAVVGDIKIIGGTYYTWDPIYDLVAMAGKNAAYGTDEAIFNLDENINITVKQGDVVLGSSMNTMPNQTLTLNSGTSFTIPKGKALIINDTTTVVVNGTFEASDISYLEEIELVDGLFILNSDETLDKVKELANETDCVYELDENVYGITKEHSTLVLTNKIEATTEKEGYTGDMVCSKCGEIIRKGTITKKLEKNPQTLDGITISVVFGIISLISIVIASLYLKKTN